jgi:hypothetical protein
MCLCGICVKVDWSSPDVYGCESVADRIGRGGGGAEAREVHDRKVESDKRDRDTRPHAHNHHPCCASENGLVVVGSQISKLCHVATAIEAQQCWDHVLDANSSCEM